MRRKITNAFPNDQIVDEEQGGSGGDTMWIINPIDGTANFARGDRQWCISVSVRSFNKNSYILSLLCDQN